MNTNGQLLKVAESILNGHTADGNAIEKLIDMLRENIREEEAKKNGAKVQPLKVIEKMIKGIDKANAIEARFAKAHPCGDRFGFTEGHRIFISNTSCGFPIADIDALNIKRFIDGVQTNEHLKLDRSEIALYIKMNRITTRNTHTKKPFVVETDGGELVAFNPLFLLDFIDFTEQTEGFIEAPSKPLVDKRKTALVLPVRCDNIQAVYYAQNKMLHGERESA